MTNLYRLMAFVLLVIALGIDAVNGQLNDLHDHFMLAATVVLLFCALIFLIIGFDMRREEESRSELFTRRAHEDDRTFEVDGDSDYQPTHRIVLKHDPDKPLPAASRDQHSTR